MDYETQADALCEAGHKAGQSILRAIDDAYEGRSILPARKVRRVFDGMIEALTDEMSTMDAPLFTASAYEAIPAVLLSGVERAEINGNAHLARAAYIRERREDELAQAADFYADQRRDEREVA